MRRPGQRWRSLTVPVQNFLRNGGATPALPDNWVFADTGTPVQIPSADVDARLPRARSGELTGLRRIHDSCSSCTRR